MDGENRTPCIQSDPDDFRQEREGISLEVVEGMQFDRGYLRVRAAIGYQGERRTACLTQISHGQRSARERRDGACGAPLPQEFADSFQQEDRWWRALNTARLQGTNPA
jgi:hypothetical protein